MTGSRLRLLARTSFGRLFEHDLLSSPAAAGSAVTWLVAALASPGVMLSVSQYYFYAHARTFAPALQDRILFVSQALHVAFAMAVAGVLTMLAWTSLTPDRRDALVLGPLPVPPREQAWGRLAALAAFFALFTAALALPTAVAFTFVTVGDGSVAEVPGRIGGHVAAVGLATAFVFFGLLDLALLLAAASGPGALRAITLPLQVVAFGGLVSAFWMSGPLADALLATSAAGDGAAAWNPAAWFVGVYRVLAGDARPAFAVLARRGVAAAGLLVTVAVLAYPLAYARCLDQVIAAEGRRDGWWRGAGQRLWLRLLAPWLRTPLERGLAAFVTATLTRSHAHRFVIGSYLAVGVLAALPLAGRLAGPADGLAARYAWFAVPLGLLWWSAAGLRVAMMLPTAPDANWAFRLTEPVDKWRVLETAAVVLRGATTVPLAACFGAAAGVAGGVLLGATVAAVVLTAGFALTEALTLTLRAVPCTATWRPGQLRLRVLWPVYLVAWVAVSDLLPRLAVRALDAPPMAVALVATLLLAAAALRGWRHARARAIRALVYDADDAPVATTLALGVPSA